MEQSFYPFCPRCGHKNEPDFQFCVNCSSRLAPIMKAESPESIISEKKAETTEIPAAAPTVEKFSSDYHPFYLVDAIESGIEKPNDTESTKHLVVKRNGAGIIFGFIIGLLLFLLIINISYYVVKKEFLWKSFETEIKSFFDMIKSKFEKTKGKTGKNNSEDIVVKEYGVDDGLRDSGDSGEIKPIPRIEKYHIKSEGSSFYVLKGFMKTKDGKRSCILSRERKSYIGDVGTKLPDGWKVSLINTETVALKKGNETRILRKVKWKPAEVTVGDKEDSGKSKDSTASPQDVSSPTKTGSPSPLNDYEFIKISPDDPRFNKSQRDM